MKLLFPTIIHEISVKNFKSVKKELVDFVYDQQENDPQGVTFSNMGGWQSQPIYFNHNNILLSIVSETLRSYFNQNVLDMSKGINFEGLWININEKGNFNSSHNHPGCHMSGVFWIKTPPKCGNISFQSPHSFTQANEMCCYKEEFRERTNCYPAHVFVPTEGSVLLFPASLMHKVEPNQSSEDRISLSFNLTFKI